MVMFITKLGVCRHCFFDVGKDETAQLVHTHTRRVHCSTLCKVKVAELRVRNPVVLDKLDSMINEHHEINEPDPATLEVSNGT